jgi:putative transposase
VLAEAGVRISMDGRGRWLDNVFIRAALALAQIRVHQHLNAFETGSEARAGIGRWITYYNGSRPHTALAGQTPAEVHTAPAGIELAA